ncbi:MAG TPA: ABC transporter ATP-binding protein [Xenococcaceae cyanobacterium]
MAKVVFDKVYKSFSQRGQTESNLSVAKESQILGSNSAIESNQANLVRVLKQIDLEVKDGEFMVLVGPSGCGKSTLLRLLAGLEVLTGGNIYIGDRLVNQVPPKARDIAMVFQNYALYPHLNVYDNIAFGLRRSEIAATKHNLVSDWLEPALVGLTRSLPRRMRYLSAREKAIRQRVRYVASLLQIESLLYRLPKELSGGQKQRVALGRAIARNPQVFLMDEPLSNLDAKLRTETRAQIVQLQKKLGITTIYVTHDQTEAMTMGDRIAVMQGGEIQQIATPLEIYNQPANRFVAEFIGSPPMNFLPVELIDSLTLIHSHFRLTLPESWREILHHRRNKQFLLGIRPQYFFLSPETSHITVKVNLVEALGSETYIQGTLCDDSDASITASLAPDTVVALGESLNLSINLDKVHLFDANTEVRLAMPILR